MIPACPYDILYLCPFKKRFRVLVEHPFHRQQRIPFIQCPIGDHLGEEQRDLLADDHGLGVVISSLHARDMTRVYAKPLVGWESTHSLTDEEKQAIVLARQKDDGGLEESPDSGSANRPRDEG